MPTNALTENRNGFIIKARNCGQYQARSAQNPKNMIVRYSPGAKHITVGADEGFDTADFVSDIRDFNVTPHVAQNTTNKLSPSTVALSAAARFRVQSQDRSAKRVEDHSGGARPLAGAGAANAAWREEAGLQVHADNGCLRSSSVLPGLIGVTA